MRVAAKGVRATIMSWPWTRYRRVQGEWQDDGKLSDGLVVEMRDRLYGRVAWTEILFYQIADRPISSRHVHQSYQVRRRSRPPRWKVRSDLLRKTQKRLAYSLERLTSPFGTPVRPGTGVIIEQAPRQHDDERDVAEIWLDCSCWPFHSCEALNRRLRCIRLLSERL